MPHYRKIDVAELLTYEEQHPEQTLDQIGQYFGVTREAVRLVLAREGRPTNRFIRTPKPPKPLNGGRIYSGNVYALSGIVRKWLALIDHGYCSVCHCAVPMPDMVVRKISAPATCKACSRDYWHGRTRQRSDNLSRVRRLVAERSAAKRGKNGGKTGGKV